MCSETRRTGNKEADFKEIAVFYEKSAYSEKPAGPVWSIQVYTLEAELNYHAGNHIPVTADRRITEIVLEGAEQVPMFDEAEQESDINPNTLQTTEVKTHKRVNPALWCCRGDGKI